MTEQAKRKQGIEVSLAISEAVKQCDADVVSAYPITPQTHIVEHLAELVANGELDAEFIPVESEHTAMSVCAGSSAAGARTFTATASQGLALMAEIVYCVGAMRLPIVMVVANRSLNSPLSIWNDHSDAMMVRDSGWIQVFVENGQEAYDHVFWSFRVGEDAKVSHPVMLNMDGFIVTHVVEPIEFWSQDMVTKFLPPFKPVHRLHPDKPATFGAFGPPEIFTEAKMAQEQALMASMPVIEKAWDELFKVCGRRYLPVESYRSEDAKILFVTMGSIGETARVAIDEMRETGEQVGLVALRLWRPFPLAKFREAVKNAEALVVIDRALVFGGVGGPVAAELRSALYSEKKRPRVVNFIAGLAGRDVQPDDFWQIMERAKNKLAGGREDEFEIYGVRG